MNKRMFNKIFKDKNKLDSTFKYYPDDQLINICERKFKVQYEDMKNLRKNLNDFFQQIKNLIDIIDNLYACFKNIYEPDWFGNKEFHQSCQQSIKLWRIFINEFKDNIQTEFENYSYKFPEIKKSIDKCNKKAADLKKHKTIYESCKNSKKPDNNKIKKAEVELKNTEEQYNEINNILKSDLPQFCDSRIQIYLQIWSLMFRAEDRLYQSLHEERKNQLQIIDQLNEFASSSKYSILNQINSTTNHSNFVYDKKKAASVMTLFSTERRPLDTNFSKGGSAYDINCDQVYDQIPYQIKDDSSLTRTKSYQVGGRTSFENLDQSVTSSNTSGINSMSYKDTGRALLENSDKSITNNIVSLKVTGRTSLENSDKFVTSNNISGKNSKNYKVEEKTLLNLDQNDSSDTNLKNYKVEVRTSLETLNQTFTSDSTSSTYSIEKREPVKKKLSFTTESSPSRRASLNAVVMRPSPPISGDTGSDIEPDDENYIYAKLYNIRSQISNINSSPQSQHSDLKKSLSKKVSISLQSSDIYDSGSLDQSYQVVAKYNYSRQDDDELDLRKDDIILVLPWEYEDQKEDGWLYGENVVTKEKGLFPENHTSRFVD